MSYILEAIRRSEEERRKRLVPDVSTIHGGAPAVATRRPRLLYGLVAGAGLALGLAAVILLQTRSPIVLPAARVSEATAPVAAVGTGSETDDEPAVADTAIDAAPPRPTPPPAPTHAESGLDGAGEAAPMPAKAAKTRSSRTPYSTAAKASPRAAPAQPRVSAAPPGSLPALTSPPADGDGAPDAEPAESGPGAPAAPEFVSAIALRDLPEPVRRALPDIAISLHRYANSAEARQVRVNGRAVREGDVIGDELTVAEITRSGVVFTIGGQRFYMSAFQNWRSRPDR